jgi:hypothetical protein
VVEIQCLTTPHSIYCKFIRGYYFAFDRVYCTSLCVCRFYSWLATTRPGFT